MKKSISCLLLCAMLCNRPLYTFIYQVIVLERINPASGKKQRFIGLSDFHDKKNSANAAQLFCVKDFLHKQDKAASKIILEDLSSTKNGAYGGCRRFQINSRGGILGGLAQSCSRKGLQVDNVEYRYCRVAALGPLLNNAHKKIHDFPSTCGLMVSDIVDEINAAIVDIVKYTKCCAALQAYRERILKKIYPHMRELNLTKELKRSMADYVHQGCLTNNRFQLLKRLLIFDSALLDLKLAQSILDADTCDTIIAVTGGSHIARVQEILESAGYTPIYSNPSNPKKEPKPLDLDFLKGFLR
ncbi:hypothetical protein JST99_00595 [Candidatus Dependentiae bacterium]|nr:hypothetical protein [Candidatus Dependentiae bacterium]MCC7415164.1 hypothetical protein [Campylobacterota bacterium]